MAKGIQSSAEEGSKVLGKVTGIRESSGNGRLGAPRAER